MLTVIRDDITGKKSMFEIGREIDIIDNEITKIEFDFLENKLEDYLIGKFISNYKVNHTIKFEPQRILKIELKIDVPYWEKTDKELIIDKLIFENNLKDFFEIYNELKQNI